MARKYLHYCFAFVFIVLNAQLAFTAWVPTDTIVGEKGFPTAVIRPNMVRGREFFYDHYVDKYGAFPEQMIWKNESYYIPVAISIGTGQITTTRIPNQRIKYSDIKAYVYWAYHEADDTTFQVASITQIPDTTTVGSNWYGINIDYTFDSRDLPISKDTVTYIFHFESHTTPDSLGPVQWRSEPLFYVAQSYVLDAIDSIQWARNFNEWSPQLVENLLKQYPYNLELLYKKLNYALDNDSTCAVIKATASTIANSIQNRLDPMTVTQEYKDWWDNEISIDGEEDNEPFNEMEYLLYIINYCKRPPSRYPPGGID